MSDLASKARECSTPWWQPVVFASLAGGMAWGIRGQYGHETGAMIAGVLVSLTIVALAVSSRIFNFARAGSRLGHAGHGHRRLAYLWPDGRADARHSAGGQLGSLALGHAWSGDQRRALDRLCWRLSWAWGLAKCVTGAKKFCCSCSP